jgi:hypothetical protein
MSDIPWPMVGALVALVAAGCGALLYGITHDSRHAPKRSDPDDFSKL